MENKKTYHQLYRFFDKYENLLYIGISLNAVARQAQHKHSAHWYSKMVKQTVEGFPTRHLLEKAEKEAIKLEKPLYNKIYNGDRVEAKGNVKIDFATYALSILHADIRSNIPEYDEHSSQKEMLIFCDDTYDKLADTLLSINECVDHFYIQNEKHWYLETSFHGGHETGFIGSFILEAYDLLCILESEIDCEKYLWVILNDIDNNKTYVVDPEKIRNSLYFLNEDEDEDETTNMVNVLNEHSEERFNTDGFENYALINELKIPNDYSGKIIKNKEYCPYLAAHQYLT